MREMVKRAAPLGLWFAGCNTATTEATAPTVDLASSSELRAWGAVSASAERSTEPPSPQTKTIQCGDLECPVEGSVCCNFHQEDHCGDVVDLASEDGWMREDNPQIDACQATTAPDRSLMGYYRCDESSDCGATAMCCLSRRPFGRRYRCTPTKGPGVSPCELAEVCREGSPCRTKGTVCIKGRCRRPEPVRRCGTVACTEAAPACCGSPPTCRTMAACDDEHQEYRCVQSQDCPLGLRCAAWAVGSVCVGNALPTKAYHDVCDSDGDCASKTCPSGTATCTDSYTGVAWFRSCECP